VGTGCNYTCDGKGCRFSMTGSGEASFNCKHGGCSVDVLGNANAHVECQGGGCTVSVIGNGNAEVRCPGGKCTVACSGRSKCVILDCPDCVQPAAPSSTGPDWGAAKGRVDIDAPSGKTRLAIDQCWSGEMLSFYGAEMFQQPDIRKRVRAVEHPVEGQRVVLIGLVPGKDRVVVDAKTCSQFSMSLKRTNHTLNRIGGIRGSLVLDCKLPEARVTANVTMEECAFDNRAKGL
jgi:hypothetical protein